MWNPNFPKIITVLIWKITIKSGLNFAHVMTAKLSWHVQNWDRIGWLESITAKKILTTFYLVMSTSTVSEMGPWSPIQYKDNEELALSAQQWQWMVMRQTPINWNSSTDTYTDKTRYLQRIRVMLSISLQLWKAVSITVTIMFGNVWCIWKWTIRRAEVDSNVWLYQWQLCGPRLSIPVW